jgi:2,4-dienoyl-CoA reductase-like NADH-dependent reductase (Old Yellow Enzyme family)
MLIFGTPREMSRQDIEAVIDKFAAAARLAHDSGFQGVEVHAARKFYPLPLANFRGLMNDQMGIYSHSFCLRGVM